MNRLLLVSVLALSACTSPMVFEPDPNLQQRGSVAQNLAACKAEGKRDMYNAEANHGSGLSVALGAQKRATACMEGRGFIRVQ
jgi:hypothetical protein